MSPVLYVFEISDGFQNLRQINDGHHDYTKNN